MLSNNAAVLAVTRVGRDILGRKLQHNIKLIKFLLLLTSRFNRSKLKSPEIMTGFLDASSFLTAFLKLKKIFRITKRRSINRPKNKWVTAQGVNFNKNNPSSKTEKSLRT